MARHRNALAVREKIQLGDYSGKTVYTHIHSYKSRRNYRSFSMAEAMLAGDVVGE